MEALQGLVQRFMVRCSDGGIAIRELKVAGELNAIWVIVSKREDTAGTRATMRERNVMINISTTSQTTRS